MPFQPDFMHSVDSGIALFFNGEARRSWVFDQIVAFWSVNNMVKGAIFMALVWWAWFRKEQPHQQGRQHLVATMLSCAAAMAVGRMLVLTLPFRPRPMNEPGLDLVLPYGVAPGSFHQLSSFPSDHAVLFFALATGLCFISRRVGAFAWIYAVLFIALPRMYLGLHYLSDILAGATIGVTASLLGNVYLARTGALRSVVNLSASVPQYFYPLSFLLTFQIAELFESSRAVLGGLFKLIKQIAA